MTTTTDDHIRALGRRWAEAEQGGDVAALDDLSTDDFTLVGPLGFVLTKDQWLDRYRSGTLVTRTLAWEDVHLRLYDQAAVAVGVHDQQASFRGTVVDGRFRATHVCVRSGDRWLLASQHYAFLISDEEFDAAFERIGAAGVVYYADPGHRQQGQINRRGNGRGCYFADPDGHNMELLTRT